MPVVVGIKVVMSFSWYRRSPPTAHVDGLSLSAGLVSVHVLVRRYQNIRHLLREPHILQAVVDGRLSVGIPQQAEVGAAA